jgi:hypothetical protein
MKKFTSPVVIQKNRRYKLYLYGFLTLLSYFMSIIGNQGQLYAQLTLSAGVVNTYQKVSAVSGSTITLTGAASGATHTFAAGDKVLLVQMTGLTSANGGKFEYVTLAAGTTATSLVTTTPIARAYTPATEKVQVVWIPYNATSITVPAGGIAAKKWNGTTGGIVSVLTPGTLTLNGTINADGAGFRYADGTNTINGTDIYYGGGAGTDVFGGGGGGGGYGSPGVAGGLSPSGGTTPSTNGTLNGGYPAVVLNYGGGGGGVGGAGSGGSGGPHSGGGGGGAGYGGGADGGAGGDSYAPDGIGGTGSAGGIGDTNGTQGTFNYTASGGNNYSGGGGGANQYVGGGVGGGITGTPGLSGSNGGLGGTSFGGKGGGTTAATFNQYQYCDGSFNCPDACIWMAGGGQNATQGAGIVMVSANTVVANGKTISANGDVGTPVYPYPQALSAGGDGLVIVNTQNITAGPLTICAKGGEGGKAENYDGTHGGGAGGGGLVWVQDPLGGVGRNNANGTPPAKRIL